LDDDVPIADYNYDRPEVKTNTYEDHRIKKKKSQERPNGLKKGMKFACDEKHFILFHVFVLACYQAKSHICLKICVFS